MAVCRCARGRSARGREFITLIGGAAAAWPLKARAQQPGQIRRVGMLIGYAEDDPETQARLAAFRVALEQLGWKEGRSVRIDYRLAVARPRGVATRRHRAASRTRAGSFDHLVGA